MTINMLKILMEVEELKVIDKYKENIYQWYVNWISMQLSLKSTYYKLHGKSESLYYRSNAVLAITVSESYGEQ